MRTNISCFIVMTIALPFCMNVSPGEKVKPAESHWKYDKNFPVEVCVVLCDFSASQGSSLQTIKQNAITIYNSAALNSELWYYDINAPHFEGAFVQSLKLFKNVKKPSEEKQYMRYADSLGRVLEGQLAKRSVPAASQSTCIITALNTAVQSIIKTARKDQSIEIIVLSDMLEDCPHDFGRVDIDNANFDVAMKMLDKMQKPEFGLKEYKKIKVSLTASSRDTKLSSDKLYTFWKKALNKFDYELKEPITAILPAWTKP
jgi:hypothetical protein